MKIAMIADLHFGVKSNNPFFQRNQLDFFEKQMAPELKVRGIDTIFVLGDIYDNRFTTNIQCENVVINLFQNTFKDFKVHMIVGNHDLYHKTSVGVNSLKSISLLDNVTVYEKPTILKDFGTPILMLPWITDYAKFAETLNNTGKHYKYAMAHLDIVGFNMGGSLCENGITVADLGKCFDNVFTGHFHSRSKKKFGSGYNVCNIEYIGSPYQITRIDMDEDRGYTILDLDNGEEEFVPNMISRKFQKFTYPCKEITDDEISKSFPDLYIPYEFVGETKKIYELFARFDKVNPDYKVNVIYGSPNKVDDKNITLDTKSLSLEKLFSSYVEQTEYNNKDKIVAELERLYLAHKGDDGSV